MQINDGDTVLKLWAANLVPEVTGREGDWLCIVVRTGDGRLRFEYRFRYHNGPGFDAGDEISRAEWSAESDSPEQLAKVSATVQRLFSTGGFAGVHEVEINGGTDALMAALMELPGWQVNVTRQETKGGGDE